MVDLDESSPSVELLQTVGGAAKLKAQNWSRAEVIASQKHCMAMEDNAIC